MQPTFQTSRPPPPYMLPAKISTKDTSESALNENLRRIIEYYDTCQLHQLQIVLLLQMDDWIPFAKNEFLPHVPSFASNWLKRERNKRQPVVIEMMLLHLAYKWFRQPTMKLLTKMFINLAEEEMITFDCSPDSASRMKEQECVHRTGKAIFGHIFTFMGVLVRDGCVDQARDFLIEKYSLFEFGKGKETILEIYSHYINDVYCCQRGAKSCIQSGDDDEALAAIDKYAFKREDFEFVTNIINNANEHWFLRTMARHLLFLLKQALGSVTRKSLPSAVWSLDKIKSSEKPMHMYGKFPETERMPVDEYLSHWNNLVFHSTLGSPSRKNILGSSCSKCGDCRSKDQSPLKKCDRCEVEYYCSRNCQVMDWKLGHKRHCRQKGEYRLGDKVQLHGFMTGVYRNEMLGVLVGYTDVSDGHDVQWIVKSNEEKWRKEILVSAANLWLRMTKEEYSDFVRLKEKFERIQ
ncbi:hypothetical protein BCR33DRAFT_712878, partial [Rhizoclosmatium globosum]